MSIAHGSPVYGVVSVGSLVHVIRENSTLIQVYDASNSLFRDLSPMNVLGKIGYYDMVYLPIRNSLALLNWFNSYEVFIISLDHPYTLKSFMFTTTLTSAALAVDKNEAGDDDLIIVTQSTTRNITVFTPDGKLVLAFRLLINKDPRQAIKLPGNLYATTFGYEPTESHYVCRFNKEGYIVGRCFGGIPGNSLSQVNVPARLQFVSDFVVLADMKNKRILKIARNMTNGEVLLEGISNPYRLQVDEKNGYLYVAENELGSTGLAISGKVNVYAFDKPEPPQ